MGAFCAGYAATPDRGMMLVLYGNNGAGKTHLANRVYRWASRVGVALPLVEDQHGSRHCPRPLMFHWPTYVDALKGGNWSLVEDAEQADLLLLDELGGSYDPTKLGLDKLCRILSTREKMWTLVTTNLVPDSWEEAFDRRVASRLIRNSQLVDMTDVPDYSTVKGQA